MFLFQFVKRRIQRTGPDLEDVSGHLFQRLRQRPSVLGSNARIHIRVGVVHRSNYRIAALDTECQDMEVRLTGIANQLLNPGQRTIFVGAVVTGYADQ